MPHDWVSWDDDAPKEAIEEAYRRNAKDNIPRHAFADGRIKKWDWQLAVDNKGLDFLLDSPTCISLEEHIARLLDGQQG